MCVANLLPTVGLLVRYGPERNSFPLPMPSFYAELKLAGIAYRVVRCQYACHQSTDARGRATAKVRHDLLALTLDVPDDDALLAWAAAPFTALAGEVVFYSATQLVAHETIAFAAGQCVGYAETFESGGGRDGAYVCHLTVAAPSFELRSGGPGALAAVMGAVTDVPAAVVAAVRSVQAASPTAPMPALPAAAEYTLADFAATIGGAEHMQPQEVITQLYDLYNAASAASVPGKPSMPHWKAVEDLMRSSYYKDPEDGLTKKLNGHWPPANGGYQRQMVQLKQGDVFDRYQGSVIDKKLDPADPKNKVPLEIGDEFDVTFIGEFLSPVAIGGASPVVQSFESRALDRAKDKYPFAYTIEVLEDVPMDAVRAEFAQVIPWYDQPGGGTQMRLEFPKKDWKWQEWKKMQNSNYAKITLDSSPNGAYEVLPNNRARKIA